MTWELHSHHLGGIVDVLHDDLTLEHCGSHAVETDLADIQGLLACCLR
jgi:hypothetical protein